jgi:hypothetical protein
MKIRIGTNIRICLEYPLGALYRRPRFKISCSEFAIFQGELNSVNMNILWRCKKCVTIGIISTICYDLDCLFVVIIPWICPLNCGSDSAHKDVT